jgi:hypothetical protein
MSNESIAYLVAGCAGVLGLAAFVGLILVPAWSAYDRFWQRVAATVLSLYVLATFIGAGIALGALVIYEYDRL